MGNTTSNSLKAVIEAASLGLKSVSRDRISPGVKVAATYPYVTIMEGVAYVPDRQTSTYDKGVPPGFIETVQVDLWQMWRNPGAGANNLLEDVTIIHKLVRTLHGIKLATTIGTAMVWGVKVTNVRRLLEEEENIVHHAITLSVVQELY